MQELGYCSGIENYSRVISNRAPGSPPLTLLDYFPKDFLLLVDESHVTLPQLRPTTFFASTMLIISCFKIYDVVAIMTEGGPGRSTKMLVTYIYDEAFSNFNYGIASAIAMVLLVIVLIFTLAQFSMEDKYAND